MNFKLPFEILIISYVATPSMGQFDSSIGSTEVTFLKDDLKNLDGKQKIMNQSTSLMARSGPPVGLAFRLNQLEAEFRQKIEEIKTQTSRSSKDQDEKIAIIRVRERNLAQLLNETREEMVGVKAQNKDQAKRIDQLEQKLTTLQNTPPASSAQTRGNKKDKIKNEASNDNGLVSKVSTPPSSCEDLAMLDYYLDGFYLVKNKQTRKIQTVFCKFSDDNKVVQELVGTVDIKTKTVHFYVQRNSGFSTKNAVIPFELARLNEGAAFHLRSGIFTVPVPGIYHFEFSTVKSAARNGLYIYLKVNGDNVGSAYSRDYSATPGTSVAALSASLRLAAGDRVNLFKGDGVLFDDGDHTTHFSGWLVEEDLM